MFFSTGNSIQLRFKLNKVKIVHQVTSRPSVVQPLTCTVDHQRDRARDLKKMNHKKNQTSRHLENHIS